jgi:hypothetical protein
MLIKGLAAAATAAIMATVLSVTAADAAKKRQYRADTRYQYPYQQGSYPASLDGRVTGQPRTCGFDTFQRNSRGGTVGPYCH